MVKRILDCMKSDFEKMTVEDLKQSIRLAEGRTILAQSFNGTGVSLTDGVSNPELGAAFGADIIMLNGYALDDDSPLGGIKFLDFSYGGFRKEKLAEVKKFINRPMGVYLECVEEKKHPAIEMITKGRLAVQENFHKAVEEQADFIVLGGNPKMNSKISDIIKATEVAGKTVKGKTLIFSGKWEDGVNEKVLGDPTAAVPAKDIIRQLIDLGADVINFPAPGSRQGITVEMIRELVEFVHIYSPETMTMSFIDGSVEGADVDTIRILAIKSKETGADIHALGDSGLGLSAVPENIYQLSLSIKGRRLTYKRMAARNR